MKITDYPQATELASDDSFIIDGPTNGTRHIPKENLPWGEGGSGSVLATDPIWVSHRNTYRGKNLGTIFTEEQKAAISSQTFDDLYIGDYWTIGGFDWLIADINYWLNTGDTNKICTTPHLVIVPKASLYNAKMNDSRTSNGGYIGSKMYTTNLNSAKNTIYSAFGENYILEHNSYLSNNFNDGTVYNVYIDSKVDLMNQLMVYGFDGNMPVTPNGNLARNQSIENQQLALFRLNVNSINIGTSWWTRDIFNNNFTKVSNDGLNGTNYADLNNGVRPVFGLVG